MNRNQRRLVRTIAPVAGLLAAGLLVWQGSTAAFNATTNNTGDSWATGKLKLQNNGGGTAMADTTANLFAETGIKPGVSGVKCITVESTGSLAGALKMYRGAITGTNATNLATALTFSVDTQAVSASTNIPAACTGWTGGTTGAAYNGTLNGLRDRVHRRQRHQHADRHRDRAGRLPDLLVAAEHRHRQHAAELLRCCGPDLGSAVSTSV